MLDLVFFCNMGLFVWGKIQKGLKKKDCVIITQQKHTILENVFTKQ